MGAARQASSLTVAPEHPALDGHFPGRPIVPAVVLLAEVLAALEAATGLPPDAWVLSGAKFMRPVGPGTPLALVHEAGPAGRRFEIRDPEGHVVASGSLARSPAP